MDIPVHMPKKKLLNETKDKNGPQKEYINKTQTNQYRYAIELKIQDHRQNKLKYINSKIVEIKDNTMSAMLSAISRTKQRHHLTDLPKLTKVKLDFNTRIDEDNFAINFANALKGHGIFFKKLERSHKVKGSEEVITEDLLEIKGE